MDETKSLVSALDEIISLSDLYLHKTYLNYLDSLPIVPLEDRQLSAKPWSTMRLIHIQGILHEKEDDLSGKLKKLFGVVEAFEAGVMLILQAKKSRVELYIGICSSDADSVNTAFQTFIASLKGVLPGCKFSNVKVPAARKIMGEVFAGRDTGENQEPIALSAVSAFPCVLDEHHENVDPYKAVEKIDVLLDGMRGDPFSMVFFAKAVPDQTLTAMQAQLELLSTQLSALEKQTLSLSESDTDSVNLNYSQSVTANKSYSTGLTYGMSHTHGEGTNDSDQTLDEEARKKQARLGLLGTAAALALPLAGAVSAAGSAALSVGGLLAEAYSGGRFMQTMFYSSALSGVTTNISTLAGRMPNAMNHNHGLSEHDDYTESKNKQFSFSISEGTTDSSGYTLGNNKTTGSSAQYTLTNKRVSVLMAELDREIYHIQKMKRGGAFYGAAYFVAGDTETAVKAANLYRAMTETNAVSPIQSSPIYRWEKQEDIDLIVQSLCRGIHPVFALRGEPWQPYVEAAQMVGLNDIPIYFSFPHKSIPGFVVSEYAGFSRDIIVQDSATTRTGENKMVPIGQIYHLGTSASNMPVALRMDDLTKHMFVAGATGVGKSNFCYQLLDQLIQRNVKILVIEPAKGEYAGVFGNRQGFHVFGADVIRSPVLRINPFAFPEGISAVQHIERLMDIFNASWTMYDAMPAILKEAIEKIYADRGFDLYYGRRPKDAQFPCFDDLLEALPAVIEHSQYSREVKGNYTGALVTRVRSLTNGLYRMLFNRDEVGDEILFNQNTIVDISRIGSSETKALLMGILTMRLSEYRMCEGCINSPLRHVTVLEEAHHLLRRGGASEGAFGVNLRGASVEMITNAIAEMRTYGEGFVIADQSPSVLDASAVRNTHTKVFFMLPDKADRDVAGDSLSISNEQTQEIARLSPGVAAVYQNGWTSAVLCKIKYFPPSAFEPFIYHPNLDENSFRELIGQAISVVLTCMAGVSGEINISMDRIREIREKEYLAFGERATLALRILADYDAQGALTMTATQAKELIPSLLPLKEIICDTKNREDRDVWGQTVEEQIDKYAELSQEEMMALVQCGISWFLPASEIGKTYAKYIGYRHQRMLAKV